MKKIIAKFISFNIDLKTIKPFLIFNRINWITTIILFIVSSCPFVLAGFWIDYSGDNPPPTEKEIPLLITGVILLLLSFLFLIFTGIIVPIIFKKSQDEFIKTVKYSKNKLKFNSEKFLKTLSKQDLKRLKKLLYIDSSTYQTYKKLLKNTKKQIN